MIFQETIVLPNKIVMPRLAYGTLDIENQDVAKCVADAISMGYRHIDTALAYGNEVEVGEGIRNSGVAREEIFVTTKVPAEVKSVEGAIESIKTSLRNLNLDYIDLLLIHAPMPWEEIRGAKRYFKENTDVWAVMEKFHAEGTIKVIGLSNFKDNDLDNIIKNCNFYPMVNQIKLHPGSSASITLKQTFKKGIVAQACSPLGRGKALDNSYIKDMAEKYGVSPARLCLRYSIQKGCCPIVKAVKREHMEENLQLNFVISEDDMKFLSYLGTMKNLKKNRR